MHILHLISPPSAKRDWQEAHRHVRHSYLLSSARRRAPSSPCTDFAKRVSSSRALRFSSAISRSRLTSRARLRYSIRLYQRSHGASRPMSRSTSWSLASCSSMIRRSSRSARGSERNCSSDRAMNPSAGCRCENAMTPATKAGSVIPTTAPTQAMIKGSTVK
jgi:hypothetical protein